MFLTRIPDIELNQEVRNTGDFKKIFDQEQAEYALDLRMFFNVSQLVSEAEEDGGGGPEAGGQTVYIARVRQPRFKAEIEHALGRIITDLGYAGD